MAPTSPCGAPAIGGGPLCDLPAGHDGQHAHTSRAEDEDDGQPHTYRWGASAGAAARRSRPVVQITLSDAARARLREIAERRGWPASRIVEEMILGAEMPRRRNGATK